jgi:uncharacterized protein (UPF0332 family)
MGMTDDERLAVVEFRIEKSLRAFEQAKGVVELKYWETIANRLYYAAYNAVSALLIANGDTAQSHSGVIHLFGLNFIRTNIFPAETGKLYHKLFTMRQTGDYDDTYGLTENDVLPYIEPTGQMISEIVGYARKLVTEK